MSLRRAAQAEPLDRITVNQIPGLPAVEEGESHTLAHQGRGAKWGHALKTRRALENVFVSGLVSLLSLAAGATAVGLAEFGAPVWVFVVLLAWLLTLGLPTLAAVLLVARFWPGPSLQAFGVSAAFAAFSFQLGAVFGIRWVMKRRRQMSTG